MVALLVYGVMDAGWVHLACNGRALSMVVLACADIPRRVVAPCIEVKDGVDARCPRSIKRASGRGGRVCQMALLAELRGARERGLCGHPHPALSLDPSQPHSERVNRRVPCEVSV